MQTHVILLTLHTYFSVRAENSILMIEYLRNEILNEHTKTNTAAIVAWIGTDVNRVKALMELYFGKEYKVIQRSSWIVGGIAETNPSLIGPYLPDMLQRISDDSLPIAVKRHSLRSLQFVSIPEALEGYVLDTCFRFLEDPKEANAVQVFALSIVEQLTYKYPEIIPEFELIITTNIENGASPAFISRAKKALMRLQKKKAKGRN